EEKQITDNFYADYSTFKRLLFEDLCENNPESDKLLLFKKTQKLLDRILFILFCEDRNLLPANSVLGIIKRWEAARENFLEVPLYNLFKQYFNWIDKGFENPNDKNGSIFAYNGGLFKTDEVLDNIKVGDDVLFIHTKRLADYDFESQISVDILGRIFENSLTEIEEVQKEIEAEKTGEKVENNNVGKRKKDGVFYTPEYITKYIVENTIGKLCEEKREELKINDEEFSPEKSVKTGDDKKTVAAKQKITAELDERLENYRKWLLDLKILDPACGSGAFLNAALQQLKIEHTLIDYYWSNIHAGELNFTEIENTILENNLYGVDINEESVEIAKLSLWLHTAKKNRKLTTLNGKIKCGNSLIDDPSVAGEKAFKWEEEFPEVFEKGGFDVVIGNPPYVQLQSIGKMSEAYAKCGYESYNKSADLYCLFTERGFSLLKKNGLQSFIMPNKWMLVDYGKELRKFMSKTSLQQIINFGDVQFFKDAATIVCIFVIKKSEEKNKVLALSLNQKTYKGNFLQEIKDGLQEFSHETFNENIWQIKDKRITMIFNKMKTIGKPLKNWAVEINNGIKTGFNDAFYIDEKKKHDLINQDSRLTDLIKPMLRGEDVGAFYPNFKDLYLINFHNGIKARNILPLRIEDYPVLKTHFDKYFEKLSTRSDKGITPYNLRNCAYLDYFDKPKIMYSEITKFFPFMLDNKGMFCNNKVFFITAKDDTVSLSFLTAVFNSKLCKLWIWYNCPELLGGTREIRKAYFENFPIPDLKNSEFSIINSELANLADKMLSLNETLQKKSTNFLKVVKQTFALEK
ncbi:MAG: Eco57I restriction-modification methylase domain-containing protein, partial [Treponema sp.]